MNKPRSTDATSKLLGYEYQKLIAIKECFEARKNTIIYLECFGDVAVGTTVTEVKHHQDKTNLTDNSVDFWKTVKNYINDKEKIEHFSNLIFHTTSDYGPDTMFKNWNKTDASAKVRLLKDHTPSESIKGFHKIVSNCPDKVLEGILARSSIHISQMPIGDFIKSLVEHAALIAVVDKYKVVVIEQLIGYLTTRAISDSNCWRVDKNDFDKSLQNILKPLMQGKIKFPKVPLKGNEADNSSYKFVDNLTSIGLKQRELSLAVNDFFKSKLSLVELMNTDPDMIENLDQYDTDVLQMMYERRFGVFENMTREHIDTDAAREASKTLYRECRDSNHEEIQGVEGTDRSYRNGRMHNHIEDEKYDWNLLDQDIDED